MKLKVIKTKILIQENFIVLNYELIFWAKYHNKYYARFVQISIDKKQRIKLKI